LVYEITDLDKCIVLFREIIGRMNRNLHRVDQI
jgi:hypothetical protein